MIIPELTGGTFITYSYGLVQLVLVFMLVLMCWIGINILKKRFLSKELSYS